MTRETPAPHPLLIRVAWAMTAMMAASVAYTATMMHLLHSSEPFGITWFWRGQEWCDFRVFQDQSLHFRTAAYWNDYGYPFTYPAPLAVTFGLLYRLAHPLKTYLLLLAAGGIAWVAWLTRGLTARGWKTPAALAFALIMMLTAWPVWYLVDTTNIEGLMAIFLALGVLAVLHRRFWTGAVLIGIAASMKLFPVILLALLLSKRRYKEFAAGLAVAMATTWASLYALGPSVRIAQQHLSAGMEFLRSNYMVLNRGAIELNFSHSLFNCLKFAVLLADRVLNHGGAAASRMHEQAILDATLPIYLYSGAIIGAALYLWRIRTLPMLNQTIALTTCAVLLPPFSSDYTLVHMLVPFALLCFYAVEASNARDTPPGLATCFACLCIILGFESFFTIHYGFASPIRALALCILFATALRYPFHWTRLDSKREGVRAW